MNSLHILLRLLPILMVLTACRSSTSDVPGLAPCRIAGIEREVRCGSVRVPEDPDSPSSRQIEIHFAVVPAVARNKQSDPIFVLAGGPGQAATKVARQVMPVLAELNARRDLVFIDQRGTGRSNPLECEVDETSLASALEPEQQIARLGPCLKTLPADLRQYATWIAVRDFDAIRKQLGAEKINLWGASYGTRAALEYMRQVPEHVRSVVLDGVAPPDMVLPISFALDAEAALKSLGVACERDERCRTRYPDFDRRIATLLKRAESGGIDIRVPHPLTGAPQSLRLDRKMLASMLRVPLYVPQLASVLPYALAEAASERADFTALVALSAAISGGISENFAVGMHFAVVCAEDVPRIDQSAAAAAAQTRFGSAFAELYREACRMVPTRPVPPGFYSIPLSKVPVLIFSGGLDPSTPPRHGESVSQRLGNARHLIAPNLGHGISAQGCAPMLISRFVRDASFERVDGECLAKIPAPYFFAPIDAAAVAKAKSS
ncbi:MAG: alpha/beta fold hydrolase [Burkholderiaceae bacterium]